jgi:hypothetical protein
MISGDQSTTMREFIIPARYYAHGKADWHNEVLGMEYYGEKMKPVALSTANTAIAAMHVSANEFLPGDDVKAYWDDWSARSQAVTRDHIAPLFESARGIGLRILYICAGWSSRHSYPQFREIAARVPSPAPKERPPVPEWKLQWTRNSMGTGCRVPGRGSDIAPEVAAQRQDWIVDTTEQACRLFSENGIWNILYVGFDVSGCVLTLPGGVLPMRARGYRCFILEDCVESCETPQTRDDKKLKQAVLQTMQLGGYSYLASGGDVIAAIKQVCLA